MDRKTSREDVLYGLERLKRRLNFMHGQELEDFLEGAVLELEISPWGKTGLKRMLNIRII